MIAEKRTALKTVFDVSRPLADLFSVREDVVPYVNSLLTENCESIGTVKDAISTLLAVENGEINYFRLVSHSVLGALVGQSVDAMPLCAVSRTWWAGAEVLDDIADGDFDAVAVGLSGEAALLAATACVSLVPHLIVRAQNYAPETEVRIAGEIVRESLACVNGQMDDLHSPDRPVSWRRVMVSYAGKTGAPYARDTALAAVLAGCSEEQTAAWRTFGRLFGVLRQLANDRAYRTAAEDADLANGTMTLLLAHAVEILRGPAAEKVLALRPAARRDPEARAELWRHLRSPEAADSYDARVTVLESRLSAMLRRLADPSDHRHTVEWMIKKSARTARLSVGPDRHA
ncbi:polyprenyl synthetase family protein [Streptomyces sp. SL13]|uniref:Polyprenyl synthetase family protein n=1 Tax=Streptantibioticus silvisoli TaxID=2705255 RepID=A0AA90KFK2_9ACTN|nr:polyprenyl synthetase family protein [Streptantibioticus silvisoli]MDI5969390.1 polyprenyl synthetase family protein [Streptantibioticus silvisoli]